MIKKMNIAFIASTLALLSTLYSCKKETTTTPTNSELTVGPLELVEGSLNVSGANFKVAISDPAGVARKKKLCYSPTVQSPTIDTAGKATGEETYVIDMGTNLSAIVLMGLSMGKTYYVRAAVVTKSGAIVYSSNVLKIITKTATAGNLTYSNLGYDTVTLNTTAGSSGTIVGKIYYSTSPDPAKIPGTQSVPTQTQVVLKDLTPGTKYYAQIGIETGSGEMIIGSQIEFTTKAYAIGGNYKGGMIFYIDGTKLHGLIVAKEDIGESAPDTEEDKKIFKWGLYATALDFLSDDGSVNTNAIISKINDVTISNQTAAGQCVQYQPSGSDVFQTGWYLPSIDECKILLNNKAMIPNLKADDYWTSSRSTNVLNAVRMNLNETELSKIFYEFSRNEKARVRAIHKF